MKALLDAGGALAAAIVLVAGAVVVIAIGLPMVMAMGVITLILTRPLEVAALGLVILAGVWVLR